jgi:hypothetical protein
MTRRDENANKNFVSKTKTKTLSNMSKEVHPSRFRNFATENPQKSRRVFRGFFVVFESRLASERDLLGARAHLAARDCPVARAGTVDRRRACVVSDARGFAMNSREGFPQAGGPDGISPPAVASDRAAKAYEKAFLESANSNESKLRLLESA